MVNANEKWEPVEVAALRPGDKVRVTHPSGDVVVGIAKVEGPHRKLLIEGYLGAEIWPHQWARGALTFERVICERTLPSEPGWYVRQSDDSSIYRLFVDAGHNWYSNDNITVSWTAMDKWDVPDDLVRLVPAAEIEAAERRGIRKAHDALESLDYRSWASHALRRIFPDVFGED